MSAIAGMIDWRGGPAAPIMRKALAALALHGRDGEGFWDGGDVALGWRRTILHEEDKTNHQPLTGGGGRFHLVFDGRIDNREELAGILVIHPERARTMPDSAYVLAAFEKWGEDCPRHLLGDFAFAIWDNEKRELFLARDHFGRRPLVYHRTDRFFFFASMPSALFTNPDVPREIDEESFIREICLTRVHAPKTFYRDIARVGGAQSLSVTRDNTRQNKYWRLEDTQDIRFPNDEDYVDALRERFDAAVECCLRTIHPLGSHLSSGWDSSSVTATAARLLAKRDRRLTAFTHVPPPGWKPGIASPRQITDEGPLAAMVAARFPNVDHVPVHSSGRWDFNGLDHYASHFERPRFDATNGGWYHELHRNARARGIRVMLTGMEGNYSISARGTDLLSKLLRNGNFLALSRELLGLRRAGQSVGNLVGTTLAPLLPPELREIALKAYGRSGSKSSIFYFANPAAVAQYRLDWRNGEGELGRYNLHRAGRRGLMLHRSRGDRSPVFSGALAAWDIDMRDPADDKRIWEFCYAIPDDQFLRQGQTKWLLRRAMKGVLPDALLNEKGRGRVGADSYETAAKSKNLLAEEAGKLANNRTVTRIANVARIQSDINDANALGAGNGPSFRNDLLIRWLALGRYIRTFEGGNK
jgi:asparagine synthase (glutamine-hydrolysing)